MMERLMVNSMNSAVPGRAGKVPLQAVLQKLTFVYLLIYLFLCTAECKEYCHNQDFTAECLKPGEVILMEFARYGRMTIGPCVKTDFGFVGCSADVIDHTHEKCSGRKSCVIRVPDATLDRTRPCNEDLKSYLEATYTCVTVASPDSESCKLFLDPDSPYGYVSSSVSTLTDHTGQRLCGSTETPWVISVPTGQRINFTLMDFTSSADPQLTTGATMTTIALTTAQSTCDRYLIFEEESATKEPFCGSGMVEMSHATSGNLVKVTVFYKSEDSRFLLKYEAIGCPDVTQTPPNVWLKRETNRMTAGCVTSEVTWQLVCVGNRWEGSPINCSIVSSKGARREDGLATLSFGASILIIVGVSLAIGLIVLVFGLYYMKRRREGLPIGVRGHQMRDMKPLSSEAAYEAASVYARNTAFEPVRVATHPPGGKGVVIEEGNEYEYVWDVPSNMMSTLKASRSADLDIEETTCVGHGRPPDLIKSERASQCRCLANPSGKQRSATLAKPKGEDSIPVTTRFASLEGRVRMGGRKNDGGTTAKGGREGWECGVDTVRVCKHCGHSIVDPPPSTSSGTPNSVSMSRRPFLGPHTSTTATRSTTQGGRRSGPSGTTFSPTTMPRTHRH